MTRVLVAGASPVMVRAAHLLAESGPEWSVAFWKASPTSSLPAVDTADGFDVVLTEGPFPGGPMPVTAATARQVGPSISGASEIGLALALAADLGDVELVAVARPGEQSGSETVVFPSPIDSRAAVPLTVDGRRIFLAEGEGPLAACMAWGGSRHRMVLDDHLYLAAVCLAAAVELRPHGPSAVWDFPDQYLRRVVELGLVLGERPAVVGGVSSPQ